MIGTGYIIEVKINIPENEEVDYSLGFYVERDNVVTFSKNELVRITTEEGIKRFAFLNSDVLGRGHLMCRVEFKDKEPLWNYRPHFYTVFTGVTLGNCLCCKGEKTVCNGIEFSFNCVEDVPKDINARVYYGVIKDWITGYEFITEDIVKKNNITEMPVQRLGKTLIEVCAGDRVVVLVPCNEFLTPYKDDGFGRMVPFNTSFMGANGRVILNYNGIDYWVYGEMMTVNGNLYIYID